MYGVRPRVASGLKDRDERNLVAYIKLILFFVAKCIIFEVGERSVKGTVLQLLYHARELDMLLRRQALILSLTINLK